MKKFVIIGLTLLLALGGLGAAYAAWTDQVTISETVSTGEFCMEIGAVTLLDGSIEPPPYVVGFDGPGHDWTVTQIGPGFPLKQAALEKNVGWGTFELSEPKPGTVDVYSKLDVTLHNVYPCYYNHLDFWLHNCGTIPLKIYQVILKDEAGNVIAVFDEMNKLAYRAFDFGGEAGVNDFEIQYGNNWGAQLEPCSSVNMSMGMHVLQDHFAENETWSFSLTIVAIQWNEYPY